MTQHLVVVGGGISGLTVAYEAAERARANGLDLRVSLFDENAWPGGKIRSDLSPSGFLTEWGPNGFLDSRVATLDLCRRVGLGATLLRSNDAARKRFVYFAGRLQRFPESPGLFLKSRLLTWRAKFRLLREPFIPPAPPELDETLTEFGTRRLGPEVLQRLLDPMVQGVMGGDPDQTSVAAAFPRIKQFEQQYGSLIRAMRRIAKERRRARRRGEAAPAHTGPAPGGVLTSFPEGLSALPRTLARRLGPECVALGQRVTGLARADDGYTLTVTGRPDPVCADAVVLAAPAYASAELVAPLAAPLADALREIPYARMAVVALGFKRAEVSHPLDGFGFLIPHSEARPIMGALWCSSIWPGRRAPDDAVLLRTMVGGMRNGANLDARENGELVDLVRAELGTILGITAEPCFVRVDRHGQAIPQYPPGHLTRLARIDALTRAHLPRLFLTGNAYRGVGLNDCIQAGLTVAEQAIEALTAAH